MKFSSIFKYIYYLIFKNGKTSRVPGIYVGVLMAISGTIFTLSACSGGSSATSSSGTVGPTASALQATLSGAAIDKAIPGAVITFTSGAPLNYPGATTIGTATANASGVFSAITVTLPSGSVPIFANAADPINSALILNSYLGQASALATAGVLTSSNLPDLDITPVTTAALAVYYQINGSGSYANLTPTLYSTNLQTYNGDILAIAAAIKVVGDNLCNPVPAVNSTTSLAAAIAAGANLTSGNSTTLATAATILGGTCPTVIASIPQQISADPQLGPGLYLGEIIDAGVSSAVPSVGVSNTIATYILQGVIAESGMTNTTPSVAASAVPASVFNDVAVMVDSNGNVSSTDANVTGTIIGNIITLAVKNATQTYSFRGKVGVIQSTLTSGGTAYAIQSGGTNTISTVLTNFNATLSPVGVSAIWNANVAPTTTACASGAFSIRLEAFSPGVGGGSVGECITPSATGWSMSASTLTGHYFGDHSVSSTPPVISAPSWAEVSSPTITPFILHSAASVTINGTVTTGTMYYVMGTTSIVLASNTGNNILLNIDGNTLTHIAESASNNNSNSNNSNNSNGGQSNQNDH